MLEFYEQTALNVYILVSLCVGGIFAYQSILSYISYRYYKISYAKYLILICIASCLICFSNILGLYLNAFEARYMNAHLNHFISLVNSFAYVRLMQLYLGCHLRWMKYVEFILMLIIGIALYVTVTTLGQDSSIFFKSAPPNSPSLYIVALGNSFTVSLIGNLLNGLFAIIVTCYYIYFIKVIWLRKRQEKILLIGIISNFIFIYNDVTLILPTALVYSFPLLAFSYLIETIRLTYVIQQQSALKVKELEGEIIQIGQVAELGFWAGNITHDIRNPLTVIMISIDKLEAYLNQMLPQDQKWKKFVAKIQNGGERMVRIIDDYLALMRKETEKESKQTISLCHVIAQAIALCEKRMDELPNFKLLTKVDKNIYLQGYENLLVMILVNMLGNACDAIAKLEEKWISIEAYQLKQKLIIRLSDSGQGIPEADILRIFEKRFTTKERGKGTGLGLDFVKRVVEAHGGSIHIDRTSLNTCFVLTLPACSVSPKSCPEVRAI